MAQNKRIGDILLASGIITEAQLKEALQKQKETKERLGDLFISSGIITETQFIDVLKIQLGIDSIDLTKVTVPAEMAQVLSKNIAKKFTVLPVKVVKDTLYLAMPDPLNFIAIEEVKSATRKKVIPLISSKAATEHAITALYSNEGAARAIEDMKRETEVSEIQNNTVSEDLSDSASAPTIRLVNSIIERAITEKASDIHCEPRENEMLIRMRIDGLMRNILTVPHGLEPSVISRLKIMGSMDISEHRVPQDGRAKFRISGREIDLRISTLPTIFGEKIVLRILDRNSVILDKTKIGLDGESLKKFDSLISNHSGVVLIVGPTGSGKTSTLYTMIKELNSEQVNLVTLEDPVEYNIDGINQVQINEKTGMTFAAGLRAILRQDPDIVAVGEIRDGETAQIAMRAAMTGHLVLSTIHTNDAISTIDRLLDIGVEPYLISGGVKGIISQRLVRKICEYCKTEYSPTDEELHFLNIDKSENSHFYHGAGCPHCFNTGYRGRMGVFEVLTMTKDLRAAVSGGKTREELEAVMEKNEHISLFDACKKLVSEGNTTIEEVRRTIADTDS